MKKLLLSICLLLMLVLSGQAQNETNFTKEEVIYGRKQGMALTMAVLTPTKVQLKQRGVILAISAGMRSSVEMANEWSTSMAQPYLLRGYTVFEVMHGSAPKYNVVEIVGDMHRAVRFIRYNAQKYSIDPEKLGMTGASSGGHLSLMMGNTGFEADADAKDPVDRVAGNVQAVACFFPPTDFLNFGKSGEVDLGTGLLHDFRSGFEFSFYNKQTKCIELITDETKRIEIGKTVSPINFISSKSAPTFIAHGDADALIPLQQSETFIQKLKEAGIPCELVIKKGGVHAAWPDISNYMMQFANWFDVYLK